MTARTKIEWVANKDGTQGKTWNPMTGCTKISAGCANCYAERFANRFAGKFGYPERPDHFDVTLRKHSHVFRQPYTWKKPYSVFVCSMGDLFHEDVPETFIEDVFDIIIDNPQHTFIVLTKRPENVWRALTMDIPNLWLGVTAENQETADKRIPYLLQLEAPVRFLSVEPMLGPIDLTGYLPEKKARYINTNRHPDAPSVDWVICGGETGSGAREMKPEWAWDLLQQCRSAHVPFFFKKPGDAAINKDNYPTTREFPNTQEEEVL
jgi:protein gp37